MAVSKVPYKLTSLYTAVLLGIFPLWAGPYSAITGVKYRFFFILCAVYLGLMALSLAAKAITCRSINFSRPRMESLFFLAYLLWALISCSLSPYDGLRGEGRAEGLITIALYVLCFISVSVYGALRFWHLFALGAAVTANALMSFVQLLGINIFSLFPAGLNYYDKGVYYAGSFLGTLGNTNVLSAFLTLAVGILMGGCAAFSHRKCSKLLLLSCFAGSALLLWSKADSGLLAAICCAVLFFPFVFAKSETRKAWALPAGAGLLGFAAGVLFPFENGFAFCPSFEGFAFILAAVLFPIICRKTRREWKISAKGLIIFYSAWLAAALLILYFVPFSTGAAKEAHLILHGAADPAFGSGRLRIWKRALQLIREKPLFGSGPDTFVKRVGFEFSHFIEQTGRLRQMRVDCAHNEYLNIAANCGLGALLFFLLAAGTVMIKAIKNHRRGIVLALAAACTAYMVQLFFTFSVCSVSPVFYLTLALLSSHCKHTNGGHC